MNGQNETYTQVVHVICIVVSCILCCFVYFHIQQYEDNN